MRLPPPDRPEADVVRQRLHSLEGALDWPAVADVARPWVEAVRAHPAPFWALESLLQEFPISSQEGLALMRLAEALLRVPDAPTAIALTADQLGRATFDLKGGEHAWIAALSANAIVGTWIWDLRSDVLTGDDGFRAAFGIAGDAETAVERIMKEMELDTKRLSPRSVTAAAPRKVIQTMVKICTS